MKDEKGIVPIKAKLAYGIGDLGISLPLSVITFFLLYFYTDVVNFSPILAGTAMFIAKGWDAISDPLMGQITDKTKSPLGRRRPYLRFVALPYAFFFIILWTPIVGQGEKATFFYLLTSFILFFTASTAVSVPYNALLPELSLSPHERTKLTAYRQPFSVIGWVAGSALVLPLVDIFTGAREGFFFTTLIFGMIAFIVFIVTFFGVKERPDFMKKESLPITRSFLETLKNGPFWIFIAVYTLISLGYTILSTVLIYYSKYWLGDEALFTVMMGIVMGFLLLSIPLWVFISGKIGKKEAFLIGIVVLIIAAVLLFVYPQGIGTGLYIIMGVAGIGTGAYFLFPYAIMPEIIDTDELVTGTRREGAFFGIYFLIFKIAIATAPFITGLVLKRVGYVANVEQTETALFGIRVLVGGIPLAFFVLGFFALLTFPLTKKRYEEISLSLSKIRRGDI